MFEELDLADAREQLDPANLGHEVGQRGLPPLASEDDPHEQRIVALVETRITDSHSALSDQLNQAYRHFAELQERDQGGGMHAVVKEAEARCNQVEQNARPELQDKRSALDRCRTDLGNFRTHHTLSRAADYPDRNRHFLMVGLVAILFVFGSAANAVLLAKGNELGIVRASTVALSISLANLIPPFLFFGPVSRYFVHVHVGWRVFAGACAVFYAGIALTLNLGAAHYRETSGDLLGDAGAEVVRRMTTEPFGLRDPESWLLFGIGLIFSLIAFGTGRRWDDAYPGYGPRDRKMLKAREDHLDGRDTLTRRLEEIREEALDKFRRIADDSRSVPHERQKIAKQCRRLFREFDRHSQQLQQVGAALIAEYREANRNARPLGGVPRSHRKPWRLTVPEIDRSSPAAVDSDRETQEGLQGIENDYRQAVDHIHEYCQAVQSGLLNETDPTAPPMSRPGPIAGE